MSDDYYYYKERCRDLENELITAQKTIANLQRKLYDVQSAVRGRTVSNASDVLSLIAWTVYDWKD
jgi:ribosomal protein L22